MKYLAHQQRIVDSVAAQDEALQNLIKYTTSVKFQEIDGQERSYVEGQVNALRQYVAFGNAQIAHWGVIAEREKEAADRERAAQDAPGKAPGFDAPVNPTQPNLKVTGPVDPEVPDPNPQASLAGQGDGSVIPAAPVPSVAAAPAGGAKGAKS